MANKGNVVWFHYNKPYSQKHKTDKWSVHFKGTCYIVDNIVCNIPTKSKTNNRQPRVVMKGIAKSVKEKDGTIVID
jgi:hypothetical protein